MGVLRRERVWRGRRCWECLFVVGRVEDVRVRGDWCHWGGRGRGEGRVVGDEVLHVKGGDRGCHRPPHWLVGPGLVDGVPAEEERQQH